MTDVFVVMAGQSDSQYQGEILGVFSSIDAARSSVLEIVSKWMKSAPVETGLVRSIDTSKVRGRWTSSGGAWVVIQQHTLHTGFGTKD